MESAYMDFYVRHYSCNSTFT